MSNKLLQAAAGNAGGTLGYVEDVFSTYLYTSTGTASAITIENDIDLAAEGGLVWIKGRSNGSVSHSLYDTERGGSSLLSSNRTDAAADYGAPYTLTYNNNGFAIPAGNTWINPNTISTMASWTFRKAEKCFDVVTWVGSNNSSTDVGKGIVPHNLGVAPAVVIVKNSTQSSTNWIVYHKDQATGYYSVLNSTAAQTNSGSVSYFSKYIDGVGWQQTNPDADNIYIGYNYQTNGNTDTMVAYLFASDAGGFGDDGEENIIKCGSYTGNGSTDGPTIDCGFEPQWLMIKNTSGQDNWNMYDNMRGIDGTTTTRRLYADQSGSESDGFAAMALTATGFKITGTALGNASGNNYIYIAIRRPMKTPESGTEVFAPVSLGATTEPGFISNFVTDFAIHRTVNEVGSRQVSSRMTGNKYMFSDATNAEGTIGAIQWDFMNGSRVGNGTANANEIQWMFKRATGFMDVVCYTGDGVAGRTVAHNLGVAPELMIFKNRTSTTSWPVYYKPLAGAYYPRLDNTDLWFGSSFFNATDPTASVFSLGGGVSENEAPHTYIAYLFASLDGVSKVGSYTGTGADLNVDCGFSAGARFILIKRTDSSGDWYVWDSLRGIVAGNDPYLLLNTTAAEVTTTDYIDPLSSGFTVTSSAPAALNASGGSYIFLAIA